MAIKDTIDSFITVNYTLPKALLQIKPIQFLPAPAADTHGNSKKKQPTGMGWNHDKQTVDLPETNKIIIPSQCIDYMLNL